MASLSELVSTVEGTINTIGSHYALGVLFYSCGRVMMATFGSNGKLSWFVLIHDDTVTLHGDIPFDHAAGWYVEYPRRYQ